MPGEGLEPSRVISPQDFKSRASAYSATPALGAETSTGDDLQMADVLSRAMSG